MYYLTNREKEIERIHLDLSCMNRLTGVTSIEAEQRSQLHHRF